MQPTPRNTAAVAIARTIDRAIVRARLVLFWERLWPRLMPALIVGGLFLLASMAGFWSVVPDWLRVLTLAVFALAGIAALVPFASLRIPGRAEAIRRLESASGQPHRPATAFLDRLSGDDADPATRAVWEAHRARLIAGFAELRTGTPEPGVAKRDPYGFRFLLALLLVVTLIATGGGVDRIGEAFRGGMATAAEAAAIRIDAWAEPPAYTDRPSIFLTGNTARDDTEAITVPEGTQVIVRIAGDTLNDVAVLHAGGGADTALSAGETGTGPREYRVALQADGAISVLESGIQRAGWQFVVIPDRPPEIEILAGPSRANAGGLQIAYRYTDDYGITAAWGDLILAETPVGARPLIGPPEYRLTIPRADPGEGDAATIRDLTAHPWAGLPVEMKLVVEDAAGQIGQSNTVGVELPARTFTNPIAIALIAERQALAMDANRAGEVAAALDAVGAAAAGVVGLGEFLALRSVHFRLVLADTDDDLREVVDYLWDIAVALEGDVLADAMASLEDAAEALREALARGASEEEIAALTDALRQAMDDYMGALAANATQRPAVPAAAVDAQILRPEELAEMLDDVQNLAETGAAAAAEQLLTELQQMMQNLQGPIPEGIERQFQPGGEQLDDLGVLMQEQQRLMDETFALQQEQNTPLPAPMTDEEAEQLMQQLREMRAEQQARADELARQQRILRGQMDQLIEQFAADGLDPLGLPDAEANMDEAGDRLAEGRPGMAVQNQAEAIAQMQAVAEALAEQIAGDGTQLNGDEGTQDPIGRPPDRPGDRYGDNVDVPTEIERQLAREILELIRQRLEELGRPAIERQYLERLIETF